MLDRPEDIKKVISSTKTNVFIIKLEIGVELIDLQINTGWLNQAKKIIEPDFFIFVNFNNLWDQTRRTDQTKN